MDKRYRQAWILFIIIMVGAGVPLAAQAQDGADLVIHQVDDTNFPVVDVVVSAQDGSRPIAALTASDLVLVEDGNVVPLQAATTLDSSDVGISVLLVLDISRSMQAGEGITNAKAAALSILDRLRPNDRVALVAFSDSVSRDPAQLTPGREIAFSADHAQVRTAINALSPQGGTPLYDATIKALRLSRNEPRGGRAIILLTDGRDQRVEDNELVPGSVATDSDAIAEARDANIPIYTIGLGTEIDTQFLDRLADQTGGSFQVAPSADQLEGFFNAALDQLLQRYVLRYESQVTPDTKAHALMVQLNTPGYQSNATATFNAQLPEIPGVRFALQEGEEVRDTTTVRPDIFAADEVVVVELWVDDQRIAEDRSAPYVLAWDTTAPVWHVTPSHQLSVRATDIDGEVGVRTLDVAVQPPPPSPTLPPEPATVLTDTSAAPLETISPTVPVTTSVVAAPVASGQPAYVAGALAGAVLLGLLALLWQRRRPQPQPAPLPPIMIEPEVPPVTPAPVIFPVETQLDAARYGPSPTTLGVVEDHTVLLGASEVPLVAYFVEIRGARPGHVYPLNFTDKGRSRIEIGRGKESHVRLDDPVASRKHAALLCEGTAFVLADLMSSSGTRLNQVPLQGKVGLKDKDRVEIGSTVLVFVVAENQVVLEKDQSLS